MRKALECKTFVSAALPPLTWPDFLLQYKEFHPNRHRKHIEIPRYMNHLWSPWRMSYILDHKNKEGCVFCHALEETDGCENLVVHRGQFSYVILNRYPYTSGHLMVVPFEHCAILEGLSPETRTEMMELISRCVQILTTAYQAQGFNLGANLGGAAGAGIPQHVHFHIVPRWQGDTNYMSAIGNTRVVPESLDETYQRVSSAWENFTE